MAEPGFIFKIVSWVYKNTVLYVKDDKTRKPYLTGAAAGALSLALLVYGAAYAAIHFNRLAILSDDDRNLQQEADREKTRADQLDKDLFGVNATLKTTTESFNACRADIANGDTKHQLDDTTHKLSACMADLSPPGEIKELPCNHEWNFGRLEPKSIKAYSGGAFNTNTTMESANVVLNSIEQNDHLAHLTITDSGKSYKTDLAVGMDKCFSTESVYLRIRYAAHDYDWTAQQSIAYIYWLDQIRQ